MIETEEADRVDLAALRVLVVDDEPDIRLGLERIVASTGARAVQAENGVEALAALGREPFDVVLTDLMMPEMGGAELLGRIQREHADTTVVILTGFGTVQTAVTCLQNGAAHFLTKPFDNDEIRRLVRQLGHAILASREAASGPADCTVIAADPRMQRVLALVRRAAPTPVPVLIEGESGSGKEIVARTLHAQSSVADRPFRAVNAAALTDTLLESELFGHVKGAFTGADRDHPGLFAEADGGTVFLDEIASMSPAFQGKLLRVLQDKVVRPVGGSKDVPVDFRLVSASNKDLQELVKKGEFREDLYYRLRVVSVHVPPLRHRTGDILPLARHFLTRAVRSCLGQGVAVPELTPETTAALQAHGWPGNVRELENAMQRAVIVCSGARLCPWHLGLDGDEWQEDAADDGASYEDSKRRALERFQREFVCRALERTGGNVSQAAAECGLTRAAFQRILRQLAIDREAFTL